MEYDEIHSSHSITYPNFCSFRSKLVIKYGLTYFTHKMLRRMPHDLLRLIGFVLLCYIIFGNISFVLVYERSFRNKSYLGHIFFCSKLWVILLSKDHICYGNPNSSSSLIDCYINNVFLSGEYLKYAQSELLNIDAC